MGNHPRWPRVMVLVGAWGLAAGFFVPTHYVVSIHDPDSPCTAALRAIRRLLEAKSAVPVAAGVVELCLLVLPSAFGFLLGVHESRPDLSTKRAIHWVFMLWFFAALLMLAFPLTRSDNLLGALIAATAIFTGVVWMRWTHEQFVGRLGPAGGLICQLVFVRALAMERPHLPGIGIALLASELVILGGLFRTRIR